MYYNIPSCLTCSHSIKYPRNFYATCGPFFELDYDQSVVRVRFRIFSKMYFSEFYCKSSFIIASTIAFQAKDLFERFYPTEEFLPRAPDPDEIIDDDKDATEPSPDLVADLLARVQTNDEPQTISATEDSMDVETDTE